MRILVVEDEHRIATSLKKGLEQESYAVDIAFDGETGLDLALGENYDLIILDLMLPKLDGLSLCKSIRQAGLHTPMLLLTARSQTEDKILGLDTGADDYLTKPFSFEELLARIRALIRRPSIVAPTLLVLHDLSLDPANFVVKRGEKIINLSQKEFALLEYLLRNSGKVITKEQIITHVWNYDSNILENTVEVYIKNLRSKIDSSPFSPLIHTVRGFGYRLSL